MYVILLKYLKPLEEVEKHLLPHRAFLKQCYDEGIFVASGPQIPRTGGVLIAHSMAREVLDQILSRDPFHMEGIASYEVIAFDPVMVCDGLKK